ncbi:MAG: hypothetical protein IJH09_09280 [Clostridia bacterium]|nr:hypothetical protein [Clostridia bacterium]
MDDFLEIVAFRRRQGMYTALYFFCWGFIIAFGLIAAFTLANIVGVNPETGGMLFSWQSLLLTLAFGAAAFGLWRASDSCRVEYDYTFTNGNLDVSRVLNNKRRKYLTALEMKDVIRCGPAAGPAFAKTLNEPGIKRHNWFVNREANLYFFYFQKKGLKHVIVLELTQEMVDMIRSKSYLQKGVWYDADGKQSSLGPAKLSNG